MIVFIRQDSVSSLSVYVYTHAPRSARGLQLLRKLHLFHRGQVAAMVDDEAVMASITPWHARTRTLPFRPQGCLTPLARLRRGEETAAVDKRVSYYCRLRAVQEGLRLGATGGATGAGGAHFASRGASGGAATRVARCAARLTPARPRACRPARGAPDPRAARYAGAGQGGRRFGGLRR